VAAGPRLHGKKRSPREANRTRDRSHGHFPDAVETMSVEADPWVQDADLILREVLEANRQRFTEQRAAVYRYLTQTTSHPTADEVFTVVRTDISDISLATVYKALETLVSCGLANKLPFGDGSARYDARTDDHCHARCVRCGTVQDVLDCEVGRTLPELSSLEGFQVQGFRVEVVGHCQRCAEETQR
jgi:Fur family transcriptional regulator, peroxide stress response regulator